MPTASILLHPIRPAAPAAGGTLEVLVRVQAPDRPASEHATPTRRPLRVAVVIDRSGSMSGQPLHEALRCAEYIAGGLQQTDQLAVVLYDNTVQVPFTLRPAGNAEALRAALAGVDSGGSTALFDGWQAGANLLEGGTERTLSRVLLLSDGQANHGLCEPEQIQQHCARWAARGVTTSTVGLGRDFNEDLMIGMARAGGGHHYYGQTAEDLHDSFDEELALLQSLFLRHLRLKLMPGHCVVAEALGLVRQADDGSYLLPDLAWGAEAWLLVRLHIAPQTRADPRQDQALLAVTLEGEGEDPQPQQASAMLSLPLLSPSDIAGLPQDELVARRLQEIEFATATARIQSLAAQGQLREAEAQLRRLQTRVADHPWLADKLARLRHLTEQDPAMAVKEMKFSMNRTANRLAAKSEALYDGSETDRADIPAFLRRKASEGRGRKKQG